MINYKEATLRSWSTANDRSELNKKYKDLGGKVRTVGSDMVKVVVETDDREKSETILGEMVEALKIF